MISQNNSKWMGKIIELQRTAIRYYSSFYRYLLKLKNIYLYVVSHIKKKIKKHALFYFLIVHILIV